MLMKETCGGEDDMNPTDMIYTWRHLKGETGRPTAMGAVSSVKKLTPKTLFRILSLSMSKGLEPRGQFEICVYHLDSCVSERLIPTPE